MSKKVDFSYQIDGVFDSVNYYLSESPMNPNSMPAAKSTGITSLQYTDSSIELNKTYYARFGSVKGQIEKISDEVSFNTFADDPYWSSVIFYAPFTDDMLDKSSYAKTITNVGASIIKTKEGFPEGCLYAGNYQYAWADVNLNPSVSEDYTIEFYFIADPAMVSNGLVSIDGLVNKDYAHITLTGDSLWMTGNYTAGWNMFSYKPVSIVANTKYHFAVVKTGNIFKAYLNGVMFAEATYSAAYTMRGIRSFFGKKSDNVGGAGNCWLQHVRITKGVARYTADFTPPTVFPTS